jgi:hypothetical protein
LERVCSRFLDDGKSHDEFISWLSRFSPIDEHFWEDEMEIRDSPASTWIDSWVSYYRFFRTRRWFSRVWIVQEVVLARKLFIICHDDMVEWEALENLDKFFSRPAWIKVFTVLQGSAAIYSPILKLTNYFIGLINQYPNWSIFRTFRINKKFDQLYYCFQNWK